MLQLEEQRKHSLLSGMTGRDDGNDKKRSFEGQAGQRVRMCGDSRGWRQHGMPRAQNLVEVELKRGYLKPLILATVYE